MAQRSFFGDVIDREVWEAMQEQFAVALRMELHTLGPDGEDLCPPSNLTEYRRLLGDSGTFRQVILPARREVIAETERQHDIVITETVSGRLKFSVPILFHDELVATVSGGGVIEAKLPPERVKMLAAQFGVEPDILAAAADKLYVTTRPVVEAAARVIATMLDQLVQAVELRERAELRARRLAILADIGHTVTGSLDVLRVLDAVVAAIPRVMPVKAAVVALQDDDSGEVRIRAGFGLTDEFMRLRFIPGQGLLGTVLKTGAPLNVPDMLDDPRNMYVEHDRREGLRALLATPLRDGDRTVGVIGVFHHEPRSFTGGDEQMLAALADYAATAVRNARFYERMTLAYRELGNATRRLQEAQDQLLHTDQLATLGRVAGQTAHEMRNTLGGIIGAAATVRDQFDQLDPQAVREMLAAIAEEGWRMRDTIEAVRAYSKPSHYGRGAHPLAETLEESVRLIRYDHSLQHLEVTLDCPPDLRYVGDRDRLKQVLINLLRNAAEAFEGLTDRPHLARLTGGREGDTVTITLTDNGCGIPADILTKIWEPFFTTKGEAGTGLGLDNVRHLVEAQGGTIDVTSEVGVGTTFTIRLPAAAEGEADA